ncbi:MAG: cupin domain-containing protein [Desulfobaccales bacterium]
MNLIDLAKVDKFTADKPYRELLYDSPNLRVLAFNFEPGQELPVHSHPADSDVALLILEGEGEFTGAHAMPARAGQTQIMPVAEPHGLKAHTQIRLLVFIAPTCF